jgi:hypothetical protein
MKSQTRRLDILLENYVETRSRRHDYVSVMTAEKAIKQVLPNLDVSNRDFDDLIAQGAIKRGLAVHFDRDNVLERLSRRACADSSSALRASDKNASRRVGGR